MRIMLVRPRSSPETIGLQHLMLVEPLELEVLCALVHPPDEVVLVDLVMEKGSFRQHLMRVRPDVLGLTGYITHVPVMLEHCREAKGLLPRTVTVVGGVHCEVCPDDLDDPSVDFRVIRNATRTFPGLLEHLRTSHPLPAGVLTRGERLEAARLLALDSWMPQPDRSQTERHRHRYHYIFHQPVALIKTAFGCPHTCRFCFCRAITGGSYQVRPLEEVFDELAELREENVYIVDDDFLASRNRLEAFLQGVEVRGLRKQYLIYGRADFIAANPRLMEQFRNLGLRTVIVGFESFFEPELRSYHKGSGVEVNHRAMETLNRLGIDCYATLIVPPDWDHHRFRECGRILTRLGIHYVNLQPLTPLPGTDWPDPGESLILGRENFTEWDLAHVALRPSRMSLSEFYRHLIALYDRVLFQPRVLLSYLRQYRPVQLWRMAVGASRVRRQYMEKMREAASGEKRSPGS